MIKHLDWNKTEASAKAKSDTELLYAYKDCLECIAVNGMNQGYYYDEASVYYKEIKKRKLTLTFKELYTKDK